MRKFTVLSLVFLLLIGTLSCKKNSTTPLQPLDFTYTGILHSGYKISFKNNVIASTYLWDFGDGIRSTDPNPIHTYNNPDQIHPAVFTVKLAVNNDTTITVSKAITIGAAFDFAYSGIPVADNSISFSSTADTGTVFLWNFGDGSTSVNSLPTHVFQSNGSFEVTLTLNNDITHIIKKTIIIFANAVYLPLLPGTRTFHHIYTDAFPWYPYHTPHILADSVITISSAGGSSIWVGNHQLHFISSLYSDSVMFFGYAYDNQGTNLKLTFNHFTGAIEYTDSRYVSSHAGFAYDDFYTP